MQDSTHKRLEIIGFRGSAKCTLASLALSLWAALEHPDLYPFIILLADTRGQASINAASVQHELRNNDLILRDYGHLKYKKIDDPRPEPTLESDEDWQAMNCVLDNGVRILSRSRGQKVRGLKHRQHRPIAHHCRRRGRTWTGFARRRTATSPTAGFAATCCRRSTSTAAPSSSATGCTPTASWPGSRTPASSKFWNFRFCAKATAPSIERCTWKAKYPTQEAIDQKRQELGDIGFRREMLLQVVPEEGQDVLPEDIHYYDDPPFDDGNYLAHGVDLAISTKESADYTAVVSGEVTWPAGKLEIYIQPHPVIRRMTFSDTMTALDNVRHSSNMSSEFFVEAVAYQQAAIEEMERRAFAVTPMHPIKDKRARLRVAARYIKMGVVKFPRTGCEQLLTQLLGFGARSTTTRWMRWFISFSDLSATGLRSRRCITFEFASLSRHDVEKALCSWTNQNVNQRVCSNCRRRRHVHLTIAVGPSLHDSGIHSAARSMYVSIYPYRL